MSSVRLHVNIDHVATLRQARGERYPDPVWAAALAELAGADGITLHLREDRRHIQDRDLTILRKTVRTVLNLEMAATNEMIGIACDVRPDMVTLVPERREERTTEGGLDVRSSKAAFAQAVATLKKSTIAVSLFIDPEVEVVQTAREAGATIVELHTGDYCRAASEEVIQNELLRLARAAEVAANLGLRVAAGHGLDYPNVRAVAALPHIGELNIGHSIIARAVMVGLDRAVRDMIAIIRS